jgi:hypothetical protein
VNALTPQLSETWHADELFVRMKGSPHQGRYKGLAFLWNVMDKKTRFLLASKVSENRDAENRLQQCEKDNREWEKNNKDLLKKLSDQEELIRGLKKGQSSEGDVVSSG